MFLSRTKSKFKNLCFAVFIGFISNPTLAQENNVKTIPKNITEAFAKKYPGNSVKSWSLDSGNYTGTFILDGRKTKAEFSLDGTWLNTKIKMKKSQIPEAVKNAFDKSEYKTHWAIEDLEKLITPSGEFYILHIELNEGTMTNSDPQPPDLDLFLTFDDRGHLIKKDQDHSYFPPVNDD